MSEAAKEELIEHTLSVADRFGNMFRDSRKYGIWLHVIAQSIDLHECTRNRLRLLRQTALERRQCTVWHAAGGYRRPLIGCLA